ncbi:hypothetical protein MBOT_35200 [Mycobacterium botniense]|uniref:Transmembrane protein n=1 Tax=Mycobacterium botniense TaxID=84962 RepID=A0A7I9Y251_9MYCO|nr:hypothetical protein MBOT_35200 [Mycobacterium botniense]
MVFAAAMVVVRLFQGTLINTWPTRAGLISLVLVAVFVIAVVAWGLTDGRADAIANPDPDRRADLAMTWLLAGLVAGIVSGAVTWLISLFYKGLYVGTLINELTTFAAFTALLVFLPGMGGVTVGRWAVDRQLEKMPVRHHGLAAGNQDRVDTDVFAAVRADETPTGEVVTPGLRTSAVAGAGARETTEVTLPAYADEPTLPAATAQPQQPVTPADTGQILQHPPEDDQR